MGRADKPTSAFVSFMTLNDIEASGLTVRYGDLLALDSLDLAVRQGEVFGLLGPNGAGKSTAINVLCGLARPDGGTAQVSGLDPSARSGEVRALIGVCPQAAAVYPHLTGRENAELFGRLHDLSRGEAREQAVAALGRMGLASDQRRLAGKYSEGMRKRLSLAMALMGRPRILFLDEPTAAMDPQSRRAVWGVVRDLQAEGRTVVLTTHYIEEAEALCDRVGIIDHGRMIALGAPRELIAEAGKRNLEEVFIHLTGRSIREGAE